MTAKTFLQSQQRNQQMKKSGNWMYLPNTEGEHWAISDPTVAPIPLHWKSSQLLTCLNLSYKEYWSLSQRVGTWRGERSRSPKDILSGSQLHTIPKFFHLYSSLNNFLGSHDTRESALSATRLVPGVLPFVQFGFAAATCASHVPISTGLPFSYRLRSAGSVSLPILINVLKCRTR